MSKLFCIASNIIISAFCRICDFGRAFKFTISTAEKRTKGQLSLDLPVIFLDQCGLY